MTFDNWQSLLFYLLAFCLSAALIYFGNKRKLPARHLGNILTALGLALPIILAGIRHNVGRDYSSYTGMIENLQAGKEMYYRSIEPLSTLLIHFSASFGGNVVMFSLFGAISVLFAYFGIKRMVPPSAQYIALGYFMYLCIAFPIGLNAVRSGAAISVVVFAFSYLVNTKEKHRLSKFFGWLTVAIFLHTTAIICLPIGIIAYILSQDKKINSKKERAILGVSAGVALAFPLFGSLVGYAPVKLISNYSRFLTQLGEHFFIPIAGLVMLLMLAIALILTKSKASQDRKLQIVRTITMYYIPLALMVGWLSYYPSMSRLLFFIEPLIIVLITYAVWEVKGKLFNFLPLKIMVVAVVLVLSFAMLTRNLTWARALPYDTVFSKEQSETSKN